MSSEDNRDKEEGDIKLDQSKVVQDSKLIKYGFYNFYSENIKVFFNHNVNAEIKFTKDKNKWQNNYKILLNELEPYDIKDDSKLVLKKFLNDNEHKINADYSSFKKKPEAVEPESKKEEEKELKRISVYKYSASGKGQLHEATFIEKIPYFIRYNPILQVAEYVPEIPENDRVLVPPQREEYPYKPYEFDSLDELNFYIQQAKQMTKDRLFKICKNIFITFVDQEKHVIILLAADAILTYFQDLFPITHYFEGTGTNDVGKSSIAYTFQYTGYRVIRGISISGANYIRSLGNVEPGQCVIIEDEGDRIGEDPDKVNILKSGYEQDSQVPKINMNTSDQLPKWYYPFGYKMIFAEKSLREYKVPGLVDRTFSNKLRPGSVEYYVKEVVMGNLKKSPRLQKMYDQLLSFRKLMLCYRLIHYEDELIEIETGLKNRDNELCKPSLQFYYGTEALKEIIPTLEIFVKKRRARKKASLEAALYPIIKKYVFREVDLDPENNTFQDVKAKKKIIKILFQDVWDDIIGKDRFKPAIDGHYDPDKKKYAYETIEYGTLYQTTLPKFIRDKFTADKKTENKGCVLLFNIDELEKFEDLYGDIQLNEDNVKIEVKEYVTEEKGVYNDGSDRFLGAFDDYSEKKFNDTDSFDEGNEV